MKILRFAPKAIVTIVTIGTLTLVSGRSGAAPCYPNDPDDSNPGNLCLTYPSPFEPQSTNWSPIPNSSPNQPPFIQGTGKDAYYGYPVSPTQPGRIIGTTTGYWRSVEAVDGFTTITDSNGNSITAP